MHLGLNTPSFNHSSNHHCFDKTCSPVIGSSEVDWVIDSAFAALASMTDDGIYFGYLYDIPEN